MYEQLRVTQEAVFVGFANNDCMMNLRKQLNKSSILYGTDVLAMAATLASLQFGHARFMYRNLAIVP